MFQVERRVIEKLRSGEALTPKEQTIHEQGLVSVLKKIHDDSTPPSSTPTAGCTISRTNKSSSDCAGPPPLSPWRGGEPMPNQPLARAVNVYNISQITRNDLEMGLE
jgi:hypothetical protein